MRLRPAFTRVSHLMTTVLALTMAPASASEPWHWPTSPGQVVLVRTFQAPLTQYGRGHRGVDLQVNLGQPITAPASGVVIFVGMVARIPTLVLEHGGGLRSTYQPLTSKLAVGQAVKAGQVIGLAAESSHCVSRICLHFGIRNSTGYLDPVKLIHPRMPILLPLLH